MLIPFSGTTPVHSNEWIGDRTETKIVSDGEFLNSSGAYGIQVTNTEVIIPFDRVVQKPNDDTFNFASPYYTVDEPMDLVVNLNVVLFYPVLSNPCQISLYKNGVLVNAWIGSDTIIGAMSFTDLIVGDTAFGFY
jgi:hypothetical protein